MGLLAEAPSTRERATQQVTLQTSLARSPGREGLHRGGRGGLRRALEFLERNPEVPQLFPVLRGLSSFYTYRGEFEKAAEIGREVLRLAERHGDRGILVDGHFVLGSSMAFLDDLHGGLEHLDKALACSEVEQAGFRRFRLGNNPRVAGLTTSAFVLWMLGFPDRTLERADAAVALALELEHPFTIGFALFHTGFLHLWRREPVLVRERARRVLEVGEDHEFPIWTAVGTGLAGAAKAATGDHDEGLEQIRAGMRLYQGLTTPPVFWSLLLYVESGACVSAGRTAEGLALIEEASRIEGRGAGVTLVPEFLMHKGDLLSAGAEVERAGAEALYQQAFEVARNVDARAWQLRAATRLCRAAREHGDPEGGDHLLRSVYEGFTEGFGIPELVEARELLES